MSAIEISNTEIIYDSSYKEMKTITKGIPIKSSNMPIYYYDNIIIDNNLKDTIKIEYSYPDINDIDLEIELENCGTGYCLYSDVKRFKWNKQILNYLVENLKDKKIYTYDFRVIKNIYVNEQDINKIKGNKYYYHHDEERRHHTVTTTLSVLNINEGNKNNYIFLIKTKTQTEFLILDKSFNVCGDVVTHKNLASNIYNFGTYNTMIFLENNQLTSLEFCLHGDELAINSICDNVISFSSLLVNNEIIVFANLENQINIYKVSSHNSIELIDSVLNVGGLNISNISLINNNLTVMGTINQINSIITNCYGSQDMFIFEFAL